VDLTSLHETNPSPTERQLTKYRHIRESGDLLVLTSYSVMHSMSRLPPVAPTGLTSLEEIRFHENGWQVYPEPLAVVVGLQITT
jgi:hypothetical protein